MSELLSLVSAITAGFYFVMLLTPGFAARKLKTSHAGWIFWAGLLSGTMFLVFLFLPQDVGGVFRVGRLDGLGWIRCSNWKSRRE